MRERYGRMRRPDFGGDRPPQARGREDVRLVDRRHVPAPCRCQVERKLDDTSDLGLRVGQRVDGAPVADSTMRFFAIAEVDAAGQLPHDQQVHAHEKFRAKGR